MTTWRTYKAPERDRAHVQAVADAVAGETESDLQVEVVELVDADGPFWAVNVSAFGPRPVRVFTNGSLEESLEWAGEEWG